jgi:uncharacterized protein (TIGR00297 family)
VTEIKLRWQSKVVLLAVLPFVGADLVLETRLWAEPPLTVAIWTLGISAVLGLVTWKLRAATLGAAAAGAAITASLMYSTVMSPYEPLRTALMPVVAVFLLAFGATRLGRGTKERLGTAEGKKGRTAAQVAANLGVAAIASHKVTQSLLIDTRVFWRPTTVPMPLFAAALAALAEAAADTVSSEVGQVFGGRPRMITTLCTADPGTDGAVSLMGSMAGVAAAGVVAAAGTWAMQGDRRMFAVSVAGAVFGLFFDSLLGATLERHGWLNNDAVNFLSTASAAAFALALMALA